MEGNPLFGYDPTGEVLIFAAPFAGKAIVGGLAIGGAALGAYLGTPQGKNATDEFASGLINGASNLCRNTTDEGASNPPLQACLRAAEGDPEDWEDFCGGLPDVLGNAVAGRQPAKDACRRKTYESKQSKINWCHNQFGN